MAPKISLPVLGAATALGSLAIQMFVPAMPVMARELDTAPAMLQLGITLYLVGLAAGQLLSGPLADRRGRRPVLLAGILLFGAGSLTAGLAIDGRWLLAGRAAQAFGGAMTMVAGRAVVADINRREDAARGMAGLALVTLISPVLAPTLGGAIVEVAGWRTIFLVLTAASAIIAILVGIQVGETAGPSPRHEPIVASYLALLGEPRFRRLVLGSSAFSMALYAFLTAAPFLMHGKLGLDSAATGFALLWVAIAVVLGTLAHRQAKMARLAVPSGKLATAIGATALIALGLGTTISVWTLVVPMAVIALGVGLCGPANLADALNVDRSRIGAASSLFGAGQTLLAAAASACVAAVQPQSQAGLGLLIGICCLLAVLTTPSGGELDRG